MTTFCVLSTVHTSSLAFTLAPASISCCTTSECPKELAIISAVTLCYLIEERIKGYIQLICSVTKWKQWLDASGFKG